MFLKFSEVLYVLSNQNFYVCSYVSKKAKAAWDAIMYWENSKSGEITSKVSSKKNTLTVVANGRHSTVIMLMDVHKQAIEKRNWQVEFKRQAEEQKQREATLRLCLYKFPFILDFTDKKLWIAFKFN